jgi:hypothetical protein
VAEGANNEELYRRLAQARRMSSAALDPLTKQRLQELTSDIENQLAAVEAIDPEAPPE